MGYDMSWDSPNDEAVQRRLATEAVRAKTQGREMTHNDPSYFRLNGWGMGVCCDLMARFDMLVDSQWPNWPERPVIDDSEEETFDAWLYSDQVPEGGVPEAWAEWQVAHEETLSAGGGSEGIASHKFSTNDGWHVTAEECAGALAKWKRACQKLGWPEWATPVIMNDGPERPVEWWGEWLAYLAGAELANGFRVY